MGTSGERERSPEIKIKSDNKTKANFSLCYEENKRKELKIAPESIPLNALDKKMLECHNNYRKKHFSKELNINNELNSIAEDYAKNIVEKNLEIGQNILYKNDILGENIFISNKKEKEEDICKNWYEEKNRYNYELNSFQKETNNFTQMIWSSTNEVGFGCFNNDKKYCYVALYYPAGNIFGQFKKNVNRPLN